MAKFLRACIIFCIYFCMQPFLVLPAHAAEQPEKQAEQQTAQPDFHLYAQSAVLMDADSGRVLYAKEADRIMPMASTTKIMTCIVALENGNLEDYVEVSSYAASMPKVKLFMKEGERYKLKDLLYSLMLESHNDSAVAIAEHVAGSVEDFATLMNQKARDLGCFDTYFITPNGLDATVTESGKIHSTTATDLARIMSYCINVSDQKDAFLEITRTPSYSFCNYRLDEASGEMVNGGRSFSCANHNAFLNMMDGALSGKTGFTSKAGYCYVGSLRKDGKTFVVALLACGWPNNKTYKWSDTKELMRYGLENYAYFCFDDVPVDEHIFDPIPVKNGQTNTIGGIAYTNIRILDGGKEEQDAGMDFVASDADKGNREGLLLRQDEQVELVCEVKEGLEAPVKEGTIVGQIKYCVEDEVYRTELLVTENAVDAIDFAWCFDKVLWNFGL